MGTSQASRPTVTASGTPAKRVRRTAEEARRLILDAAAKRLEEQGPEGIRLQDIANDIGISHPAILHHFESREGLVAALVERTSIQLRAQLMAALDGSGAQNSDGAGLIDDVFKELSDRGTARLWAWLKLTGREGDPARDMTLLTDMVKELHQRRTATAQAQGLPMPSEEDTLFMAMLTASAAIGDAIMGDSFAAESGLDKAGRQRFRVWLAEVLSSHQRQKSKPS